MRAQKAFTTWIQKSLPAEMHGKRRQTLTAVASAAVNTRALTVTGLGRSLSQVFKSTSAKHSIKKVDRFFSNPKLRAEVDSVYSILAASMIGENPAPIILVDWTALDHHRIHALVASVPVDGRAQIIFAHVVAKCDAGTVEAERRFLRKLAQIIPSTCRPIIVTDAGFKTRWCDDVVKFGWDFLTRVRGRTKIQAGHGWQGLSDAKASTKDIKDFGSVTLTHSQPRDVRLVMSKRPKRHRHANTLSGKPRTSTRHLKQRRAQNEPWILASSLTSLSAEKIIHIYSSRMRIEEAFRDTKTARFGLGLEQARGRPERIAILFVVAALAGLALLRLGYLAEAAKAHFGFQANTIRQWRVLSLFRLGIELWRLDSFIQNRDDEGLEAWI